VANDLRKRDHIINGGGGDNGSGSNASLAPTIDEIAEALSDGEEPIFDPNYDSDSQPDIETDDIDFDEDGNDKPAYTAQTVAAISSLMKGEESPLFAVDHETGSTDASDGSSVLSGENNNGRKKRSALLKREITLQDRATAMMTVYQDYLHEEEQQEGDYDADGVHDGEQVVHPTAVEAALRREEIKVATLEKFCRNIPADENDSDEDSDNTSSDEVVDSDDDDIKLHGRRLYSLHPPPLSKPPKTTLRFPTAATTTAAFRLKAEVALKAAATTTKNAAVKAAGAVKTKVKDRTTRAKDIQEQVKEVENDFDFQDYHHKVSEEEEEEGEVQDERQDDMEYGIPTNIDDDEENDGIEYYSHEMQNGDEGSMVYGLHIIDRDNTLKRKLAPDDDEENEAIGIFNDLCDELGVTPNTHPGLRHFYQQPRSTRYKYPIFRTKKFRMAMFYGGAFVLLMLVVTSLLSAVSNGFEEVRKKKVPPLPDWESEERWREEQKIEWEKEHAGEDYYAAQESKEGITASGGGGDVTSEENLDALFQMVSAAYRPVWYDRTTGWTGRTYVEATSWCDSHQNYIPCPYEVYCPNEKTLLAGVMDEDGESWAPVVNAENEWVQVGTVGAPCGLYSTVYGHRPEWGEDGRGENEVMTRHIMCCRKHPIQEDDGNQWEEHVARPDGPPSSSTEGEEEWDELVPPPPITEEVAEEEDSGSDFGLELIFSTISKMYNPVWYDRDSGWEGQTYQESLDFCATNGYIPCPYEVYCPGGRGKLLDGIQDQDGESWSAIIDDPNDWVQVGTGGECTLYSETSDGWPSWGMTGKNNEEITRHIMCCEGARYYDSLDAINNNAGSMTALDITAPSLVTLPDPDDMLTELEEQVMQTYQPVWYNNEFGWQGTTYDDARAFCESIPLGKGGGNLRLCPKHAYCPDGPVGTDPLYLQMNAFEGVQWAPISNEENDWIMVGKFNEHSPMTCHTYLEIHQEEPSWGLDGTSSEMKKNILCCVDNAGSDDSVIKGDEESPDGGDQGDKQMENPNGSNNSDETTIQQPDEDDGSSSTSELHSSMTASEMQIQDTHHPTWFSRENGWQGTTYDDARKFCESIPHHGGTLHLCPLEAYCPNGQRDTEPLYLQMDAFEGVKWAPYASPPVDNGAPIENAWLMVGNIDEGHLVCQTYLEINDHDPAWGLDGTSVHLKEHILCCEDNSGSDNGGTNGNAQVPIIAISDYAVDDGEKLTNMVVGIHPQGAIDSHVGSEANSHSDSGSEGDSTPINSAQEVGSHASFEESVTNTFNPVWFDSDRGGWDGGSHDDAIRFCEQFAGSHGKRMELCPYAAYCPNGPTEPILGGHNMPDIDSEGEQWAPVFGKSNNWVMIGKRLQNTATTCLSHVQLDGEEPLWGLDSSNKERKKHVMCCSPLQ